MTAAYPFNGSVLLETDHGAITVDTSSVPSALPFVVEFIRLCESGYYRNCLFFGVEKDFVCYCGDTTGTGKGGTSFAELCARAGVEAEGNAGLDEPLDHVEDWKRCENSLLLCALRTSETLSVAPSIFFITLSNDLEKYSHLKHDHAVIGRIAEDEAEALRQISNTHVDDKTRPLRDIRMRKTVVLVYPTGVEPLDESTLKALEFVVPRPDIDVPHEEWDKIEERLSILAPVEFNEEDEEEAKKRKEQMLAETRAVALEILGDISSADAKPMENVLFVCKLNPITRSENLETIFSRFGQVTDCEVKRDPVTKDSLGYAFIAFATKDECEEAYRKMQDVVIDGRRIRVDFSQSEGKKRAMFSAKEAPVSMPQMARRDNVASRGDSHSGGRRRNRSRSRSPRRESRRRDYSESPKHRSRQGSRSPDSRRHRTKEYSRDDYGYRRRSRSSSVSSSSSSVSSSSRSKHGKKRKHKKSKKHKKHHRH